MKAGPTRDEHRSAARRTDTSIFDCYVDCHAVRPLAFAPPLAVILFVAMSAGCAIGPARGPTPASAAQAPASTAADLQALSVTGLLTLKGSEMDAWWALTEDNGVVWHLVPATAERAAQFRQWQNGRVAVDGVHDGTTLLRPRLKVERAQPAR